MFVTFRRRGKRQALRKVGGKPESLFASAFTRKRLCDSATRFGFSVHGGVVGYRFADKFARVFIADGEIYRIADGAVERDYIVKRIFVYLRSYALVFAVVVTPVFIVVVVRAQREIIRFVGFGYCRENYFFADYCRNFDVRVRGIYFDYIFVYEFYRVVLKFRRTKPRVAAVVLAIDESEKIVLFARVVYERVERGGVRPD